MTLPALPAQGSTSWYPYAQALDAAARNAVAKSDSFLNVVDYGAKFDGATNDTVAIQAALDANPGRIVLMPPGVTVIGSLNVSEGQTLVGSGWRNFRDNKSTFGHPGWFVASYFAGTVVRSTASSGAAITLLDTEVTQGGFADFQLIGPGAGTSIGIDIGSTTISVVHPVMRNVHVGNFATGMRTRYVNEGGFYDLTLHGCTLGLDISTDTHQNAFYNLDLQRNYNGLNMIGSNQSSANAFYSPVAQSNTNIGMTINGNKNLFVNPYCEANGAGAIVVEGGLANVINAPYTILATDTLAIQATARDTSVTGLGYEFSLAPMSNAGIRSYLQGNLELLTDTGTDTVLIDPARTGTAFGPWKTYTPALGGSGWALGNGTITARQRVEGRTVSVRGRITFGSTSTYGSASPTVSLPIAAMDTQGILSARAVVTDLGNNTSVLIPVLDTASTMGLFATGTGGALANLTGSSPYTLGVGDYIDFAVSYEKS